MYVGDQCICNLYGETPGTSSIVTGYNQDSIQVVFSSGKTVAAMLIAIMVDKGLLDYDTPVAHYWPDFA